MGRSYLKYHVNNDNLVKVCHAKKGNCPYTMHYDTLAEAVNLENNNIYLDSLAYDEKDPRVKTEFVKRRRIKSTGIEVYGDEARSGRSLSDLSRTAEELVEERNLKLKYPLGDWDYDFGGDVRLKITRKGEQPARGKRLLSYVVTYWSPETTYPVVKQFSIKDKSISHRYDQIADLEQYLSDVMIKIADRRASELFALRRENPDKISELQVNRNVVNYDRNINKIYKETISDIRQIEAISRGAYNAVFWNSKTFFDVGTPGEIKLNVDLDNMRLPEKIIHEGLVAHSEIDAVKNTFSMKINKKFGRNKENDYTVVRVPQGEWYLSYNVGEKIVSKNITEDYNNVIRETFTEEILDKSAPWDKEKAEKDLKYLLKVIPSVDEAYRKYGEVLEKKIEKRENENKLVEKNRQSMQKQIVEDDLIDNKVSLSSTSKNKNMKSKLFKLFG